MRGCSPAADSSLRNSKFGRPTCLTRAAPGTCAESGRTTSLDREWGSAVGLHMRLHPCMHAYWMCTSSSRCSHASRSPPRRSSSRLPTHLRGARRSSASVVARSRVRRCTVCHVHMCLHASSAQAMRTSNSLGFAECCVCDGAHVANGKRVVSTDDGRATRERGARSSRQQSGAAVEPSSAHHPR